MNYLRGQTYRKIIGTENVVSWDSRLHAHLSSDIDINLLINSFSNACRSA